MEIKINVYTYVCTAHMVCVSQATESNVLQWELIFNILVTNLFLFVSTLYVLY